MVTWRKQANATPFLAGLGQIPLSTLRSTAAGPLPPSFSRAYGSALLTPTILCIAPPQPIHECRQPLYM